MANTNYDAGKATLATKNADGTWSVPSFKDEAKVYIVNLEMRSCSCPQHQFRGGCCKHLEQAAVQSTYVEYLEKAGRCGDEQLERLLVKYADDPYISGAIRVVRAERRRAADHDAKLREAFA